MGDATPLWMGLIPASFVLLCLVLLLLSKFRLLHRLGMMNASDEEVDEYYDLKGAVEAKRSRDGEVGREFWQLRAQGPGLSVRNDVLRVDDRLYASEEEANCKADTFRRQVGTLTPGRYDAIDCDKCQVWAHRVEVT